MNSGVLALTVYFVFFALVHSLLADPRFKNWARRSLGEAFDRWQRLTYTILALLMMLPFIFIMSFMPDEIALCRPHTIELADGHRASPSRSGFAGNIAPDRHLLFPGGGSAARTTSGGGTGNGWILLPSAQSSFLLRRSLTLALTHNDYQFAGVQRPGYSLLLHRCAA